MQGWCARASLLLALAVQADPHGDAPGPHPPLHAFLRAASPDERQARAALAEIAAGWRDGYAPILVDLARFMRSAPAPRPAAVPALTLDDGDPLDTAAPGRAAGDPRASTASGPPPPSAHIRQRLVRFLEKQTGQRFGDDLRRWRRWYWNRPYDPHPQYARFKAGLYSNVDARMAAFFPPAAKELIRLDEVDWGGVGVDGIPPLDRPKHVHAAQAAYLKDGNVVFGVFLAGEARAYPKRILAWHELARDRLGGVDLAIVYCTLCGTVIPYGAEVGGVVRTFGTSGLLYRSNKLMFDQESMSLWSAVDGRPVLGSLAGEPLELRAYPVVTTTWKAWRERHPQTTVLSLDTGFERNYAEGAAYREYFATDSLMFEVPNADGRLGNKDEVLAFFVASPRADGARRAVAVSVRLLNRNPLHVLPAERRTLVVVTSRDGANRVYDATAAPAMARLLDGGAFVEDADGRRYRVGEEALAPDEGGQPSLPRIPARRAFWFGWHAQYPDTLLVK